VAGPRREVGAARRPALRDLHVAALVAIVGPLATGRQEGWPAWPWALLAAGPVLLAAFGWWLRLAKRRGPASAGRGKRHYLVRFAGQ
jgi:hypothetical protein